MFLHELHFNYEVENNAFCAIRHRPLSVSFSRPQRTLFIRQSVGGKLFILNFPKVTKYHRFYTLFHRPADLAPSPGKQVSGTSDHIKGQHAPGHIHSPTQSFIFTAKYSPTQAQAQVGTC